MFDFQGTDEQANLFQDIMGTVPLPWEGLIIPTVFCAKYDTFAKFGIYRKTIIWAIMSFFLPIKYIKCLMSYILHIMYCILRIVSCSLVHDYVSNKVGNTIKRSYNGGCYRC